MHVRTASFAGRADKIKEMEAHLDVIKPKLSSIPGVVCVYTTWNEDGSGLVFAMYESKQAADAALPTVSEVWAEMAPFLTAPPAISEFATAVKLAGSAGHVWQYPRH